MEKLLCEALPQSLVAFVLRLCDLGTTPVMRCMAGRSLFCILLEVCGGLCGCNSVMKRSFPVAHQLTGETLCLALKNVVVFVLGAVIVSARGRFRYDGHLCLAHSL